MVNLMGKSSNYLILKTKPYIISILVLLLESQISNAQSFRLISDTTVNVSSISIDQDGHVFTVGKRGTLIKWDQKGSPLLTFSPSKLGTVTLLEAWQGLRTFLFYRDFQEFVLLDRFLTSSSNYDFPSLGIGYVQMATLGIDNNLWVIDINDFSLKKLDLHFKAITSNTSLEFFLKPYLHEINFMKEYQNLLFLVDEITGIMVFDNLGNYLRSIEVPGITQLGFYGNEVYFLKNQKLNFIDIYNQESRTIELSKLGEMGEFELALYYDQFLTIYVDSSLKFYKMAN